MRNGCPVGSVTTMGVASVELVTVPSGVNSVWVAAVVAVATFFIRPFPPMGGGRRITSCRLLMG